MRILELLKRKNLNYPAYKQVTALFLGDSVTHGAFEVFKGEHYEIDQFYDHEAVYHNQLKKMLAEVLPNVPLNVINAGISGGNASQAFNRLGRDVLPYLPDIVVVCFGLNDAGAGMAGIETYADALRNIFRTMNEKNIETLFMTPNMMNTYISKFIQEDILIRIAESTARTQNDGIMDVYMDTARQVCAMEGVPVCDCYKKWKKLKEAGADTTLLLSNYINHPSREMHKLFAHSLLDMILFE